MKTTAATLAAVLALTGCTGETGAQFNTREAGSEIDTGYFGNATMNNNRVQSGDSSMMVNLNNRFSNEVTSTVTFPFNSTVLDENARTILRQQASWIRQFPEIRFKVFGHTDLVGSTAYNRSLGLRRAQTAVSYLISQGISRDRLEAVVSYGETQPLIVTQGAERRNRRTVTEVSGFVKGGNDMLLNGRYAEVIFREYVASAVPPPGLSGGGDGGAEAPAGAE